MVSTKHKVIESGFAEDFTRQIEEASSHGFVVVASNLTYVVHDMGGRPHYETLFYALMAESSESIPDTFTHHKILEDLNEIKFELKDIANNIKYLRD